MLDEYIRERLDYDPVSGALTWKKWAAGRDMSGRCAGYQTKCGYIRVWVGTERLYAHRICWFLHYGTWPTLSIDHINGERSDNRICNLRLASTRENNRNRPPGKYNKSGFKGVYARRGKLAAAIHLENSRLYLGSFDEAEAAARAYDAAAIEHFGVFAKLNFGRLQTA